MITMTRSETLEALDPEHGVELYLAQKEDEASDRTVQAHWYRLKHFLRFCSESDIENLNELTGRTLFDFRQWRRDDGELNDVSLRTQLSTLRVFIQFCESIDAAETDLHEKIVIPSTGEKDVRDASIESDRVNDILDHLHQFEYASREHVVVKLLWTASLRIGALRALDVSDIDSEEECLRLRHRPECGTALKNGANSERLISVSNETLAVVVDWIEHNRPNVSDEFGRKPLIATDQGRMSDSGLRGLVYNITRPCYIDRECLCGDDFGYTSASKCPHSRSPHCFRKGSLTHYLRDDVPKDVLSERADCSTEVLDRWYNKMTESEKMEQRREYFD